MVFFFFYANFMQSGQYLNGIMCVRNIHSVSEIFSFDLTAFWRSFFFSECSIVFFFFLFPISRNYSLYNWRQLLFSKLSILLFEPLAPNCILHLYRILPHRRIGFPGNWRNSPLGWIFTFCYSLTAWLEAGNRSEFLDFSRDFLYPAICNITMPFMCNR